MATTATPYQTLEVPREAALSDIKTSYKRLVLVHHPDKNPDNANATAIFQQVQAAYETLVDVN